MINTYLDDPISTELDPRGSQLKINLTNAYAGSIAWSNFFSRLTHSHPGRVVWLVFNVAIALLLAVARQESKFISGATSRAGAAGLMQVMPETGAEIATELGDTGFPVNGTTAQKQAYLKDPNVSLRYGSHYLDKMLRRYDGDLDAALVAYNGGGSIRWIIQFFSPPRPVANSA